MKVLHIDTRDNKKIIIRLVVDEKQYIEESEANVQRSQAALPLIEKLLNDANIKVSDIDDIQVEKGSGSFTGLRVGMAIANALSFAISKKVNNKSLGSIEIPDY